MMAGRKLGVAVALFLVGGVLGGAVKRLGPPAHAVPSVSATGLGGSVLPRSRAVDSQTLREAIRRLERIPDHYRRSRELHRWARTVSSEDWFDAAALFSGDRLNLQMVMEVWAARDPAGTFAVLQSIGSSDYQCLQAVFARWVSSDPDEAWRVAGRSRYPRYRRELALAMLEIDPTRGAAWIRNLPRGNERMNLETPLHVSAGNVEGLKAVAKRLPRNSYREGIVSKVAPFMARKDPEAALQWALEMGNRGALIDDLLKQFHGSDPEAAEGFVADLGGAEGGHLEEALARVLAASDPAEAFAYARGLGVGSRNDAMATALEAWAEEDAAGAAEKVGLIGNHFHEQDVWATVFSKWFEQDSAGAMTFLEAQPYGDVRWDWESVYLHWREADLDRMADYALGIPGDFDTRMFTEAVAEKFVADDRIDDGLAWFKKTDQAHQTRAYPYFMEALVESGRISEAENLSRGQVDFKGRDGLEAFARSYFATDAEAAIRWARGEGNREILLALRSTVEGSSLPPERRGELLSLFAE